MRTGVLWAALSVVFVIGCNNNQDELQKQLAQTQSDKASLQSVIAERDKYLEEVMKSVNEVYADLEHARVKENLLVKRAGRSEGTAQSTTTDTKQDLLQEIGEVGSTLKENRNRIAALQARMKKFQGTISGLDTLVRNLMASLEEREHSIAQLQTRVQGLEGSLAEKTRMVQEREMTIDEQRRTINTGYYVVGTRAELKKKGLIRDEGGFLWGLLGSTTIIESGLDPTQFTPIDKSINQTIHVKGKIEDLVPPRQESFFATAEGDESSDLKIVSPDKFWQDRYLVIIVD
jgi:hypothetical protein